jgi:hypothetical protein
MAFLYVKSNVALPHSTRDEHKCNIVKEMTGLSLTLSSLHRKDTSIVKIL